MSHLNHKQQRWVINTTNSEFVNYVSKLSGLSQACAQVLINRGIKTPQQIEYFKNSKTSSLSDPLLLEGIAHSVQRIKKAIRDRERILISGDYDADGITATAILLETLSRLNAKVTYFIPHRLRDGYGFSSSAVASAVAQSASVIITVDSGITSFETLLEAKRQGIDVIVTDHHEPMRDKEGNPILPEAYAIVNPKLRQEPTEPYNLQDLSGAGVALKLAYALTEDEDFVHSLFDLATIGTTADVVSVLGENRVILSKGLRLIKDDRRVGIEALKRASGIVNGRFKNSMVYFTINPRVNAPGRVDDPTAVVKLLTTTDAHEAESIARWMCEVNIKRQRIEDTVFREAIQQAERLKRKEKVIVVASDGWHLGVVGIVASRLVEHFGLTAFVFALDGATAKGSGRGNGEFNLLEALRHCRHLLKRYGGHRQAVGLSLEAKDIDAFRIIINEAVAELCPTDTTQVITVDALLDFDAINSDLVKEIESLEPFGYCNREPLFGSRMLEVVDSKIVGNNHLKMNLRQKGRVFSSIAFDMGDKTDCLSGGFIDALFVPTENRQFNTLQLNIKAFRPAVFP